ncbi:MAG: hypothetical protein DIU80_020645 [Chloroflexota bacterium]
MSERITMSDEPTDRRRARIIERTRQLILMRETGPKSRAWHAARVRMIWKLHDQLRRLEAQRAEETQEKNSG